MTPQDRNQLEDLISRTLRDLPARSAPSSLEARVQAEILRRASLPWWRKSFAHWPLAARGVFLVACLATIKLIFLAGGTVNASGSLSTVQNAFATELTLVRAVRTLFETAVSSGQTIVSAIPPLWLYGSIAAILAVYATLFGVGAAAYRTLYASR